MELEFKEGDYVADMQLDGQDAIYRIEQVQRNGYIVTDRFGNTGYSDRHYLKRYCVLAERRGYDCDDSDKGNW